MWKPGLPYKLLLVLMALSLGCQQSAPTTTATEPRETGTGSERFDKNSYAPASDSEIAEFGRQVAAAVDGRDIDVLDELVDWQYILRRSTETIESSREFKSQYLEITGSVSTRPIFEAWLTTIVNGGSFTFLGARNLNGQASALFRIIQPSSSLNYCDLRVGKSINGDLKCTDLRVFTTGEYLSEQFRNDFRLLVAKYEGGDSTPEFDALINHAHEFAEIAKAARNDDGELACELIEKLPSVLQTNRKVLITKMRACENLGEEAWLSAIREFMDQYPNDATTQLFAIQANILIKHHDTALQLLEELDEAIGGDPYLDALRADQLFEKSDFQSAKRVAIEVTEEEEGLDLAYWILTKVAVEEGAFADAVKWLEMQHGVEGRMEAIEEALHENAEFLHSAEFQKWKQRQNLGR